jgi:thymidylate kinase
VDRDLAIEVVSAVRRSLDLKPEEALSPANLLGVLHRDKFPLLWLARDEPCKNASAIRPAEHPQDLCLLQSEEFRAALGEDRLRYAQLHGEYVQLAQAWAGAGVRCLCFKSAGIAPSFPYAGDDIDILVPVSSVEEARRVLVELGHVELPNADEHLAWQYRRFEGARAPSPSIHLQARVGGEEGFMLEDKLWARARPSTDDPWTWVPGREDVVLINVAHALMEKKALSLRSLVRIRYALGDGDIDWDYLDYVASERGWRNCLHMGLVLVAHLEERLWDSSTVPLDQRERHERMLHGSLWWGRSWGRIRRNPPTLPFKLSSAGSKVPFVEKLWRDRHVPASRKLARTAHVVARRMGRQSGRRRQRSMLISLSGLDGSGKSGLAWALRDAFEISHVRSRIVWMRMGYTRGLAALRSKRSRPEQGAGTATKRAFSRTATGWRLAGWAIVATGDYAAWLQYVRWRLWRGDVVIADRYLCDFAVELTIRLQQELHLAALLLRFLGWLAPKPKRAYFVHINPELSLVRKPGDFKEFDPADLHARYDSLAPRYNLCLLDGRRPFEEVTSALVHDCLRSYNADLRPRVRGK